MVELTFKEKLEVYLETLYEMRVMTVLGLGIPLCMIFGYDIVTFVG